MRWYASYTSVVQFFWLYHRYILWYYIRISWSSFFGHVISTLNLKKKKKKKFLIFFFFLNLNARRKVKTMIIQRVTICFFLRSRVCVCQMSSRQSQDRVKIINRNRVRVRGTWWGGSKAQNFFFFFRKSYFLFVPRVSSPPPVQQPIHIYIYILNRVVQKKK